MALTVFYDARDINYEAESVNSNFLLLRKLGTYASLSPGQ